MTKTFTVEQLADFQQCHKRLAQLESLEASIKAEMKKLQKQCDHLRRERNEFMHRLEGEFEPLESAKTLFSLDDVPDSALRIESKHYVSMEKKGQLLKQMLSDYQQLHPKDAAVPFRWLKQELEDRYEIKTRSVSTFFRGILDKQKLTGGNKNRAIVLEKVDE